MSSSSYDERNKHFHRKGNVDYRRVGPAWMTDASIRKIALYFKALLCRFRGAVSAKCRKCTFPHYYGLRLALSQTLVSSLSSNCESLPPWPATPTSSDGYPPRTPVPTFARRDVATRTQLVQGYLRSAFCILAQTSIKPSPDNHSTRSDNAGFGPLPCFRIGHTSVGRAPALIR